MFKRISNVLFILILVLFMGQVNARAAESGNVKDLLNYLKQDEISKLQDSINNVKANYGLDVVMVITDKTDGKSSRDFADDYYDNNGYGIGSDHSGLLMLINMEKREVWISTTGKAIDIYTDSRIENMVNHVVEPLSGGKYNDACSIFMNDVISYANAGVPSGQHRVDTGTGIDTGSGPDYRDRSYMEKAFGLMGAFPVYIIALVISVLVTIIASLSSKGKVTINSLTYEESGSFGLSEKVDDFIRETTTRTKIETSSSSGKSSTHSGSSGSSHGGGGGRF